MADEEKQAEQTEEETDDLSSSRMPFMAHLVELRTRVVKILLAVALGFGVSYPFKEQLLGFIVGPLKAVLPPGQRLVYTGLPEAFFTYLKICALSGFLITLPLTLYQLWAFIAPGLYKKERRYALGFVVATTMLFLGGAIFGYQVVFPYGFQFFVGFESDLIQPLPALNQYISFSVRLLLAFGAVFELPIVMFFLARMGLVTDKFLRKNRKWAILLVFVVGAIFTPPDVVTQFLMAGPMLILFEVSIVIVKIFAKQSDDEDEEADESSGPSPAARIERIQTLAGRWFAVMAILSLAAGVGGYYLSLLRLGWEQWPALGLGGGLFLGLGVLSVIIIAIVTRSRIKAVTKSVAAERRADPEKTE